VVHLGRLKRLCKAAGQMDLLTVPSHDGADMRSKQDVQDLSASALSRVLWRPLTKLSESVRL
jgi:hypothetical protein